MKIVASKQPILLLILTYNIMKFNCKYILYFYLTNSIPTVTTTMLHDLAISNLINNQIFFYNMPMHSVIYYNKSSYTITSVQYNIT